MKILETNKNIFHLPKNGDAVCFTTNGIIKHDGKAVVGKGIALEANQIFHIDEKLGKYLQQYGNRAFNLGKWKRGEDIFNVLTFPTKHDWKNPSDIELIKKSAFEVSEICTKLDVNNCYIPPVGCGCGQLSWEEVAKEISSILDDRFIAVFRK